PAARWPPERTLGRPSGTPVALDSGRSPRDLLGNPIVPAGKGFPRRGCRIARHPFVVQTGTESNDRRRTGPRGGRRTRAICAADLRRRGHPGRAVAGRRGGQTGDVHLSTRCGGGVTPGRVAGPDRGRDPVVGSRERGGRTMARYLLLIYEDETAWAAKSPEEVQQIMGEYYAFGDSIR